MSKATKACACTHGSPCEDRRWQRCTAVLCPDDLRQGHGWPDVGKLRSSRAAAPAGPVYCGRGTSRQLEPRCRSGSVAVHTLSATCVFFAKTNSRGVVVQAETGSCLMLSGRCCADGRSGLHAATGPGHCCCCQVSPCLLSPHPWQRPRRQPCSALHSAHKIGHAQQANKQPVARGCKQPVCPSALHSTAASCVTRVSPAILRSASRLVLHCAPPLTTSRAPVFARDGILLHQLPAPGHDDCLTPDTHTPARP